MHYLKNLSYTFICCCIIFSCSKTDEEVLLPGNECKMASWEVYHDQKLDTKEKIEYDENFNPLIIEKWNHHSGSYTIYKKEVNQYNKNILTGSKSYIGSSERDASLVYQDTYIYNEEKLLERIERKGTSGEIWNAFSYEYHGNGKIKKQVENLTPELPFRSRLFNEKGSILMDHYLQHDNYSVYEYDLRNNLIKEEYYFEGNLVKQINNKYDQSNRVVQTNEIETLPKQNQVVYKETKYSYNSSGNLLLKETKTSYSNLTYESTWTEVYEYNEKNHLMKISKFNEGELYSYEDIKNDLLGKEIMRTITLTDDDNHNHTIKTIYSNSGTVLSTTKEFVNHSTKEIHQYDANGNQLLRYYEDEGREIFKDTKNYLCR